MKKKLDIRTYRGGFGCFICQQQYILSCFILGVLFLIVSVLIFIHLKFYADLFIIPSMVSLLFFYVAIISSINYYRIFILMQKLREKNVGYKNRDLEAIVYQDNVETKVFIHSNDVSVPVRSQNIEAKSIISEKFAVILIWYKELGLYSKLAQPLWIDLEQNNLWNKLCIKGFKRVLLRKAERRNRDLMVTLSSNKSDFRKICLKNFFE